MAPRGRVRSPRSSSRMNHGSQHSRTIHCILIGLASVVFIMPFVVMKLQQTGMIGSSCNTSEQASSERTALLSSFKTQRKFQSSTTSDKQVSLPKVLAMYFPQFHPDPINDRNWGQGFTDWTSLQSAPKKNAKGYLIPRPLTTEPSLGVYDLRDVAVRERQGELAKQYDLDGFIMHHYWFYDPAHPGPNLHAPLERMLQDGHPNMPFLLNWCASTWTALWTGKAMHQKGQPVNQNNPGVIQEQFFNATENEIRLHYNWLKRFFHHPNYIKVHGEPVFMSYQWNEASHRVLTLLRQFAKKDGFPGLYIIIGRSSHHSDLYAKGLQLVKGDTLMKWRRKGQHHEIFPTVNCPSCLFNQSIAYPYPLDWIERAYEIPDWCQNENVDEKSNEYGGNIVSDEIPGLLTTFDNTPRRSLQNAVLWNAGEKADVLQRFRDSLHASLYLETCCFEKAVNKVDPERRFVAINAWNEWAEAMTLEPSDVYEYSFLEIVQQTKERIRKEGC